MPDLSCERCGADLDDATAADGSDDTPGPGDVSACLYCGNLTVFTGVGLARRQPSADELTELIAEPDVARVLAAIMRTATDALRAPCGCVLATKGPVFVMQPCSPTCPLYCYAHTEARKAGKAIQTVVEP
jgi:hypothetical protein